MVNNCLRANNQERKAILGSLTPWTLFFMTSFFSISLADGAEDLGLPDMLKDLIGQNLEQHPQKVSDFIKLNIQIGLIIKDVDITITLAFAKGRLTIYPELRKDAQIVVETESDIVMALSNQTIKWGLPYYFDDIGREVMQAIKTGRLKVKGMALHFPSMVRFSRIMSVQ